jgi:hypothetical protein
MKLQYPFLTKDYSLLRKSNVTRFVFEPPDGQSGALAESVLHEKNEMWNPVENMVYLTVLFKQAINLESISIECRKPVVLAFEFDAVPPMEFWAPMERRMIGRPKPKDLEECSILHFRISGDPIEIARISFFGKLLSKAPTDQHPLQIGCAPVTMNTGVLPQCGPEKMMHSIEMKGRCGVYGFRFLGFRDIGEMLVAYQDGQNVKTLRFVLPHSTGPVLIRFPWCCECEAMTLMYIPKGDDNPPLPQIGAMLVGIA